MLSLFVSLMFLASAADLPADGPGHTERVVVTAARVETPLDETGSSVTLLDDLDVTDGPLVQDALRSVPGLDVRRNGVPGSATSIFIRGADSDQTLVLVDGVEVNDPSTPAGTPFLDHLTLDNVSRIEVLRGPQSTLYGSDAIGGVVNIITGIEGSSAFLEGGSFGTLRGGLSTAGEAGPLGYSFSASHTDSDGYSATRGGVEDDPYRNTTAAGRLQTGLPGGATLAVSVRHTDATVHFDGFLQEEDHRIDAEQTLVKLQPSFELRDGRWAQRFGLWYGRHRRSTSGSFPSEADGESVGLDWQNDLRLAGGQVLTFGVDADRRRARLSTFTEDATSFGVYAQHQLRLDRWFATFGARADDHSVFGSEATFRVTGGCRATDSTIVRASFGTGFNAPTLTELNANAFAGNPNLQPERSRGYDAGVEQRFMQGRSVVQLTWFENRIDDLIVAVFDLSSGNFINLNVDEARTRGLESALRIAGPGRVDFDLSYTYTRTEARGNPAGFGLSGGSELLRRPKRKAALALRYRTAQERLRTALRVEHTGERQDIDPLTFAATTAGAHTVVHGSGALRIAKRLELFGRIENLLDEDYEEVLGFSTAGRSGFLGIRYRR